MGNPFGKPKHKKPGKQIDRKLTKVYRSQDMFVRNLVDDAQDSYTNEIDGTGDSDEALSWSDGVPTTTVFEDGLTAPESKNQLQRLKTKLTEHFDEVALKTLMVDISKYEYPFENLVLEGGGNKGFAYCGALRILEEIGVMKNIKRFAGTSCGAMTASLLAVGYDSYAIQEFLSQDLQSIFLDHSCGYFSLLPNLMKGYGWNPGKKMLKWFAYAFEEATGNPDVTFKEIYDRFGKELCIVVTNMNMMNAEYFHPKTTPDVPVRLAVRMSISVPGLFKAITMEMNGEKDTFVDGGVLCNYPIGCFDGWWLSMKMEDSFLNRLQPLEDFPKLFEKKERFGAYNPRTLGFMLYADNERDILREILQERVGVELPDFPKTKLGLEKIKKKKMQERIKNEHMRVMRAVSAFLKVLKKHNKDGDDKISREELGAALNDTDEFPPRYVECLFGKTVTVDEAMAAIDEDQDGEVYYNELMHFIERTGVSLQSRFLGYQRKEIKGIFSFFDTLQTALLTNVKRVTVEERDIERTVGINTGHVGMSDWALEDSDRDYVIRQGIMSTEAYLKYYVVQNNPPLKNGCTPDFPEPEVDTDTAPGTSSPHTELNNDSERETAALGNNINEQENDGEVIMTKL